jgi:hypothetical protein
MRSVGRLPTGIAACLSGAELWLVSPFQYLLQIPSDPQNQPGKEQCQKSPHYEALGRRLIEQAPLLQSHQTPSGNDQAANHCQDESANKAKGLFDLGMERTPKSPDIDEHGGRKQDESVGHGTE